MRGSGGMMGGGFGRRRPADRCGDSPAGHVKL